MMNKLIHFVEGLRCFCSFAVLPDLPIFVKAMDRKLPSGEDRSGRFPRFLWTATLTCAIDAILKSSAPGTLVYGVSGVSLNQMVDGFPRGRIPRRCL